ncbi:hypothetical protein ASF88_19730 [Leifsonia sp. Leaf336]|uniref:outer membrane protein assembly factor BamB family protein n=1 Tax=Leifsonia sp. Leaf336 TaxID=1736341 RepID=UPI0006F57994|nr:PQQ-binding-like beta-propeller repeat protein [Leifsonia sp. Leaf336]KQR51390.1 hypothetical protein ASF88_19730 [Leifsonia sp. Leaf336]
MHRAAREPVSRGRTRIGALAVGALLLLAGCSAPPPAPATSRALSSPTPSRPSPTGSAAPVTVPLPGITAWPSYHADQSRTGAVGAGASLASLGRAWSASLGGAVFGQPVVAGGRVIAATETNRVVALDPTSGNIIWSASLGDPLTDVASVAGCGNIDPLGITSTPAVDTASGTVFVVGEVSTGGGAVHHQLEGLSIATGQVVLSEAVDPPLPAGEDPVHLLQRAALAVANGRVYVSFGGNYGDCGAYHGWVVGVNETGAPNPVSFEAAPDGQGGAIWQGGGAPAVDAAGNLYVSTGNSNPDPAPGGPDPIEYAESVVKLSSDLKPLAAFKDRTAGGDDDLGTGNPVLLPGGLLFAAGKTDVGFVLRQSDLSQVAAIRGLCGSDPDGGAAYDQATNRLFVPCRDGGIQAVDLSTDRLGPLLQGANGAPIVVGGAVWAVQYPEGTLSQFEASTGTLLQRQEVGQSVPHFVSPSRALGLLLVGTDTGVVAFRGGG